VPAGGVKGAVPLSGAAACPGFAACPGLAAGCHPGFCTSAFNLSNPLCAAEDAGAMANIDVAATAEKSAARITSKVGN